MSLYLDSLSIISPAVYAGASIGHITYGIYDLAKCAGRTICLSAATLIKPALPAHIAFTIERTENTPKYGLKQTWNAFVTLPIDLLTACAVMTIKIVDLLAVTAATVAYSAFKFVSAALIGSNIVNALNLNLQFTQAHDKFDRFMHHTNSPAEAFERKAESFVERIKNAASFDIADRR